MTELFPRSGELVALLSAALFGLGGVILRKGQHRRSPDTGIFMSVVVNLVVSSIALAYVLATSGPPRFDWRGIGVFVFAGLLTSFIGRWCYFASVRHIGPSRAIGYRITSPIVTLITAMLLLGEFLVPQQLLGFAAVMGGVWALTREATDRAGRITSAPGERSALPAFQLKLGIGFGLGAALALGIGHAMRKVGMVFIPSPIFGSWVGALVALVGIICAYAARGSLRQIVRANFRPINLTFLISGLFISFAQLALFFALYLSPASLVTAIGTTEPLWVLLLSRLLLGVEDRLSTLGAIAIVILCIGVTIILAT